MNRLAAPAIDTARRHEGERAATSPPTAARAASSGANEA